MTRMVMSTPERRSGKNNKS